MSDMILPLSCSPMPSSVFTDPLRPSLVVFLPGRSPCPPAPGLCWGPFPWICTWAARMESAASPCGHCPASVPPPGVRCRPKAEARSALFLHSQDSALTRHGKSLFEINRNSSSEHSLAFSVVTNFIFVPLFFFFFLELSSRLLDRHQSPEPSL